MNILAPIVVDLGKASDAHVDEIREGTGRIVEDVEEVMRQVRLQAEADGEKRILASRGRSLPANSIGMDGRGPGHPPECPYGRARYRV